jgi:hypothetical protein
MTPEQAALFSMQLQAIQPILPTPEKKWYDRLADTILGDDPGKLIIGRTQLTRSARSREQIRARLRRVLPPQRVGGEQIRVGADA